MHAMGGRLCGHMLGFDEKEPSRVQALETAARVISALMCYDLC